MLSLNYSAGFKGRTFSKNITAVLETGLLSLLSPFFVFLLAHLDKRERKRSTQRQLISSFKQLLIRKDEGKV